MDVDEQQHKIHEPKQESALLESIDRRRSNDRGYYIEQPCRFALDIDMNSFGRDPEPDLRTVEELTVNSLFPTKSFVAGFEPDMEKTDVSGSEEGQDQEATRRSVNGYPSNARLGRFYLPERAFRTPESLNIQPDPSGPWVCCRFEEYRGVSLWVLESVLEKYHVIAQRHKMALTLVGAPVHHRVATYNPDEWEIRLGEQYDVKVNEAVLYPEMIHQVWKDMYQRYHQYHYHQQSSQQRQQQQQQQQQYYGHHQQLSTPPHSNMSSQITTYEEYQRGLWQSDSHHNEGHSCTNSLPSYPYPNTNTNSNASLFQGEHSQQQQQHHYYQTQRQQQHEHCYHQQSMMHHREDLSTAPSSPNSTYPDHDSDLLEDIHTNDSASSTPHHHRQQPYQGQQQQYRPSSPSSANPVPGTGTGTGTNMHRRISIAELCNPMQSLATERDRHGDHDYDEHPISSSATRHTM
ncbi:hypothetical protein BCR41DRAFT_373995 [Lobosporangium transversale]|uniref:Uncharacterized protein n=1 Tax=Lobosporangium transversale TaxID=64571 RepID=A0A1Y2GBY2_9FUNG|nr:hypothetical protein BCR41DRAFT_373995 [Lobosporangium transversale]ORZ06581.1 hypothetical protein BCR41DRAFT_373995 [Lobosporangium transversale]|eukprot:XP_021877624.1 hypothetical protein BCR41DRAFT_373995 [Lobosporangium transversale]